MDILEKIQKIHLGLVGDESKAILGNYLDETIKDVADFQDWLCLVDYANLALVADTASYTISGSNNNLGKLLQVLPAESGLINDYEICSREKFYKEILNQQSQTPGWCIILRRTANYSMDIQIHPVPTSSSTGKYYYKIIPTRSDIGRFSNENVFIYGTKARWYESQNGQEAYVKSQQNWSNFWKMLDVMSQNDELWAYPQKRISLSEDTKDFHRAVRTRPRR